MADYQTMYCNIMRATEQAIQILIQAQQECEELYLNSSKNPSPLHIIPADESTGAKFT